MKAIKTFKSKGILNLVRQPTSIAAIASLGIHAVLFAASPQLSKLSLASLANPDELERERTVPLVNLTPEEQSRLPDFSDRPFSLVPGGNTNNSFQFPLGSSSGVPNNGAAGQSGLGRVGVPGGLFGGSNTGQSGASTYYGGGGGGFRVGGGGQVGAGSGTQQNTQGAGQSGAQARGSGAQTGASGAQAGAEIREIQPDEIARLPNPDDLEFEVSGGNTSAGAGNNADAPAPESPTEGRPTGVSPRSLPGGAEPSTNASDLFSEELAELQENYTYNAEGTLPEDADGKRTEWLTLAQGLSGNPDLQPSEPIELPIQYPLSACLSPPPSNAEVGVLINGEGELVEEPALLKRTGYLGLDRLAVSQVVEKTQAEDFPEIENFSALRFNVPVIYDAENCVDISSNG